MDTRIEDSIDSPSPSSPAGEQETILTPSRKIQALLAQYDDSDSAPDSPSRKHAKFRAVQEMNDSSEQPILIGHEDPVRSSIESYTDDEVLPRGPRGRLAARMQGSEGRQPTPPREALARASPVKSASPLKVRRARTKSIDSAGPASGDDELLEPPTRKKLLKRKQKSLSQSPADISRAVSLSTSPRSRHSSKSPSKHGSQATSDSDDLPDDPLKNDNPKFLALVEKHRKQRLAMEAAEEAKRAERLDQLKQASSGRDITAGILSDDSDVSDGTAGVRLTQQARPTRKASKKALEEMNRETQRMSRGMQLAHQAKTKKKITKESFLARFSFLDAVDKVEKAQVQSHSTTASSVIGSDAERAQNRETPPTSPLADDDVSKQYELEAADVNPEVFESALELPELEDILAERPTVNKGKAKLDSLDDEQAEAPPQPVEDHKQPSKRSSSIAFGADSDSDLEIVSTKPKVKRHAAFDRLPQKKSHETTSHLMLRSLAHVQTQSSNKRQSLNATEMQAQLRQAARTQAYQERHERIEKLRAKGVIIQTAEEREQEQQDVEDLVEIERVKAKEIQRREKELAKKNGTFVKDQFDDDSDDEDDEDFDNENEPEEVASGSEDEIEAEEQEDEADGDEEDAAIGEKENLIDGEADEADSDHQSDTSSVKSDEITVEDENPVPRPVRNRRRVLSEDDDDEDSPAKAIISPQQAKTPQSILRSGRKVVPGLGMSDDLPIGLTQAFAATMADSETQDAPPLQEPDSPTWTRNLPSPDFKMKPPLNRMDSLDVITDSQPLTQIQPLDFDLMAMTQNRPTSPGAVSCSQFSMNPTQDVGYVITPFKGNRFRSPMLEPQSTIDTVLITKEEESPVVQRTGRLRRGRAAVDSDSGDQVAEDEPEKHAFSVMKRAARRAKEVGQDRPPINAKAAIDEVAEESEDEYAGLGGASDDEGGEENEADREMIDLDEKLGQGDEGKFAGIYADEERKQDEAKVSKLFKDVTTGNLRRKRGFADDMDISDEEDAFARRREAKRREFARMRRELLKDEAVGKIAEDQKKAAFFKSIEDRDEMEDESTEVQEEESQSQSQDILDLPQQTRKPLEPISADATNRPLNPRRTEIKSTLPPVINRHSTDAEVRAQLSFLIEDQNSQSQDLDQGSSDVEDANSPEAYVDLDRHLYQAEVDENADIDDADGDNGLGDFIVDDDPLSKPIGMASSLSMACAPAHERRTRVVRTDVVDRLSLARQGSGCSVTSENSGLKPAFIAPSRSTSSNTGVFRVPTLLRRATTNSSLSSHSTSLASMSSGSLSATGVSTSNSNASSNMTERGAVEDEKEKFRKAGGGRRNAVNFYTKGRVEEREKSRSKAVVGKGRGAKGKEGKGGKGGKSEGFLGGLFRSESWE